MSAVIAQYFLNHRLDVEEIAWQMQEFAKAGYEGVYAHARQGLLTPYMSEDWWRAIDKIVEMCRQLGMEFWIWDEDYYPSGLAGGRVVWGDPGLIATGLEFTVVGVEGEGPFEVDFAPGMLLRAFAVEKLEEGLFGEIVDVTPFCGTRRQKWTQRQVLHRAYSPQIDPIGHPHWRCSMGDNRFALSWRPSRRGAYTIVGVLVRKSEGLHPDILRPEGVKRFIKLSYEPYFQRYGKDFGTLIKGAFTDEPSPGGGLYPWTTRFPEEFRADHGYELAGQLVHLALDIDERSPAVRHHYRLTQHRLQRTNYVEQISRWCEEHGIAMIGHLTRTEWLSLVSAWWPNELKCYQPMHIPAADPLGASCGWSDAAAYHTGLKAASSAAHLFGRRQASSDCLAVIGDEANLRDLKYHLDYQMVLGINHFTVHGLSYSIDGPRKDEAPPSIFYQHTEWKHMRVLLEYVRETCSLLSEGEHVCDVAVLYPSCSLACEARPGADYHRLPDEERVHAMVETFLSRQRDFDFIDETTLQDCVDAGGALKTPETYGVVVLPYLRYVDEATAKALLRFARAGGRVLAIGRRPRALCRNLERPVEDWMDRGVAYFDNLTDERVMELPGIRVEGEGARDVFVLRRRVARGVRSFLFNRRDREFAGMLEGKRVTIPARGSVMLEEADQEAGPRPRPEVVEELSLRWRVRFEANHVPLSFWHVVAGDRSKATGQWFSGQGFDLMARQGDPLGDGDGPVRYNCRFMLTGEIPDARLVMEDSSVMGKWTAYVNGKPVEGWKRAKVFDCRNIEVRMGHLLRGGSTPTLNVVTVEASGAGRGLKEVPYLYGSFTCEYRYGHLSFPFLAGCKGELPLEGLHAWGALGYPTFSGSAVYERALEIPQAGEYILDLGRVEDVACVWLDGGQVGTIAWPPYRCGLGNVTKGKHALTVEVTNGPANRNRAAGTVAGLLGPVKLFRKG